MTRTFFEPHVDNDNKVIVPVPDPGWCLVVCYDHETGMYCIVPVEQEVLARDPGLRDRLKVGDESLDEEKLSLAAKVTGTAEYWKLSEEEQRQMLAQWRNRRDQLAQAQGGITAAEATQLQLRVLAGEPVRLKGWT